MSGLDYLFIKVPIEYLFHDDRINPRAIGGSLNGLVEAFHRKRPQLHVALAWAELNGDVGRVRPRMTCCAVALCCPSNTLWDSIETFIDNLKGLPLWVNRELSLSAFGGKQNYEFWQIVFETGKTPQGQVVMPQGINLIQMLQRAGL